VKKLGKNFTMRDLSEKEKKENDPDQFNWHEWVMETGKEADSIFFDPARKKEKEELLKKWKADGTLNMWRNK
jgi:hypothetical protein